MVYGFFDHHMTYAGFIAVVAFSLAGLAFFHRDRLVRRRAGAVSLAGGLLLLAARKRAYWIGAGWASCSWRSDFALATPWRSWRPSRSSSRPATPARATCETASSGRSRRRTTSSGSGSGSSAGNGEGPPPARLGAGRLPPARRALPGAGLRDPRRPRGYRSNFTHVHDIYLQLLVEGGVLLLGAYLALVGYLLVRTGRDWWAHGAPGDAEAFGSGVFAMLVTLSIAGVFEWNVMDKEVGIPAMIAMGVYLLLKDGPWAPA